MISGVEAARWEPAALAEGDSAWSLTLMAHRPFGLRELATVSVSLAHAWGHSGLALGLAHFGDEMYREVTFHASVGRRLVRALSTGVTAEVTEVAVAGYPKAHQLSATAEVRIFPMHRLAASAIAVRDTWRRGALLLEERRAFVLGMRYRLASSAQVGGILIREKRHWRGGLGLVFAPRRWFTLRFGRAMNPSGFSGGCELGVRGVRIAYGMRLHPELDATHALAVTFTR